MVPPLMRAFDLVGPDEALDLPIASDGPTLKIHHNSCNHIV
jgi:hypothetical protein